LKVLVIHNNYQQPGGETAVVEAEVELLRQCGHRVVIYRRDSADVQEYTFLQKAVFLLDTIYSRRTYQEVCKLVAGEQPDVAHIHNVFPLISPSVYWALKDCGVPIVQTVHNYRFMCPNGLFYTHRHVCERCKYGNTLHAIRWRCYRQSYLFTALYALSIGWNRFRDVFLSIERFIAQTDFVASKLTESGVATPERIVTLGYFLPDPLPLQAPCSTQSPYIVFLGRLSPEKGLDVLLDAMIGIPNLDLKVAGDGPLADMLKCYCEAHDLKQVEFLGHITGDQKWTLLRNALALVAPSIWYEISPVVILESLAVETPVIVSDLGSLPYFVENNKVGLLFPAGDSNGLREKLSWALAHPQEMLTMGKQGRQVFEEHHSAEVHYRKLMEIFASVS
jgi:glycosyltransferase involved in cell wall biosynthesis